MARSVETERIELATGQTADCIGEATAPVPPGGCPNLDGRGACAPDVNRHGARPVGGKDVGPVESNVGAVTDVHVDDLSASCATDINVKSFCPVGIARIEIHAPLET